MSAFLHPPLRHMGGARPWHEDADGATEQAGLKQAMRQGPGRSNNVIIPPGLTVHKVIGIHPETGRVDLRPARGSEPLRNVRVSAPVGTGGGLSYLQSVSNLSPLVDSLGSLDGFAEDGKGSLYALVSYMEEDMTKPVVIGWLTPPTTQMLFREVGLKLDRHAESGIYTLTDAALNYERVLPDGSYEHWGPSLSGHRVLTRTDVQKLWSIPQAAPQTYRLHHSAGTDLQIDAGGAVTWSAPSFTVNGRSVLSGFSATDYGAVGDGNSHPLSGVYPTLLAAQAVYSFATSLSQELDYCGIQKAITTAATTATGAAIAFLPAGKYRLGTGASLTLPAGINLVGSGWGATYLVPGDTTRDVLQVAVGAGSKQFHNLLSGFAIYPTANFSAGAGIHLGNVGKCTLRDIKIDASLGGKPYYGIQLDTVSDSLFDNVRVEGTVSDAWYLSAPNTTTIVEVFWTASCTARNAGGWGFHVVAQNTTSGDIEGLHWEATSIFNNTAGGILLDTGASGTKTIRNVHLNGTYLDTNLGPGLLVQGTPICENLVLQGVWASANTGRGLDLGANVRAFLVSGGLVQQNGTDGVQINGAQNGTVNALLLKSNSQTADLASYGLVITGAAQEVVCSNLHIYNDSGGYPHRQNGVFVGNSVLDIDFKNIKADTGSGTTKLSHNAASSQRVRYASFQDTTGSNNVEQGMSISSGTAIYTRDGFGSIAMTGNLGVSGSTTVKQLTSSLTGGGKISQGSGAPSLPNGLNPAVGDLWARTDTPTVANQLLYVCTVGGATPTWVGKL